MAILKHFSMKSDNYMNIITIGTGWHSINLDYKELSLI